MSHHQDRQEANVQGAPRNLDQVHPRGGEEADNAAPPNLEQLHREDNEDANNGQDVHQNNNVNEEANNGGAVAGAHGGDGAGVAVVGNNGAAQRNQRRNLGNNRPVHLRRRLEITVDNVRIVPSAISVIRRASPMNPRTYSLTTLSEVEKNGSRAKTAMVVIILGITPLNSSSRDGRLGQRQQGGFRQQATRTTHDKQIILMDPLSPEGSNVLCMFQGGGLCPRLWDVGPDIRDNGTLRE